MIFYFDENLNKKVAEALDILDMDNTIKSVKNEFEGKLDLDLIPLLAKEEAILITFDKKMRRLQSERKSLENNKMIVFFLASYPTGWDFVKLIIKSQEKIITAAEKSERPAFYRIKNNETIEKID